MSTTTLATNRCRAARLLPLCGAVSLAAAWLLASCQQPPEVPALPLASVRYTEARAPCEQRDPLRGLYFGDLHVHTIYSWDAYGYDLTVTPAQAYAFARGATVRLPPLDAQGAGTRPVRIGRPLDFAAVTDHAEFFGETQLCRTAGSGAYDTEACQRFRRKGPDAVAAWGIMLGPLADGRDAEICGTDGARCRAAAAEVWAEMQRAAEQAYDRSSRCEFVTFVGYEYTATPMVTNQHRNVIHRNAEVTDLPLSYFEQPTPWALWRDLQRECLDAGTGCDAIVIPHNSNWSNGAMFVPSQFEGEGAETAGSAEEAAALRAALEPVVEIFQHKGDMECENGLSGVERDGDPSGRDPHCDNEKLRPPLVDCGDAAGWGAVKDLGCVSRYDFLRGVLFAGLSLERTLAINPYRLGVIGGTDTHNGTPGNTQERGWPGHVGNSDATPADRLGDGNITHRGRINNPGGLAAVWAVERSRDAIFEAFERREVYSTSGTRIAVRLFGGWDLGVTTGGVARACDADDPTAGGKLVRAGYGRGVPMGDQLAPRPTPGKAAPQLLLVARWDPGTDDQPGALLQQAQIVKGWLDADGEAHEQIHTVAGSADSGATADPTTCQVSGPGHRTLCALWTDPGFDPAAPTFYYARVLENPTCRWSTWQCNALAADDRPDDCDDPDIDKVIQERAVSSAIWYVPSR